MPPAGDHAGAAKRGIGGRPGCDYRLRGKEASWKSLSSDDAENLVGTTCSNRLERIPPLRQDGEIYLKQKEIERSRNAKWRGSFLNSERGELGLEAREK